MFWLWFLPLAGLPWLLQRRRKRLAWPTLAGFGPAPSRRARWLRALPWAARGVAVLGLVVALARPQTVGGTVRVAGRGVTIVAALDRSSSMSTRDFPGPGGPLARLDVARTTLEDFAAGRPDDLVGLVAFARYPDLVAAPSLDQGFLLDALAAIRPATALDDGTNLGDAIAWSLGALRDSPTGRRVLILLTDGRDAPAVPHPMPPLEAAALARGLGVVVHTVAIGKPTPPPSPDAPPTPAEADGPDLALLARIAEAGGGRSFAAADAGALADVLRVIDALETSPVSGTVHTLYDERFAPWAGLALGAIVAELLLASTRLRAFP